MTYPLPDPVRQEIVKVKRNDMYYVFVNPETGRPWQNMRSAFSRAKKKAGINREFRMHDLRYSFVIKSGYAGHGYQNSAGVARSSEYYHDNAVCTSQPDAQEGSRGWIVQKRVEFSGDVLTVWQEDMVILFAMPEEE